MCARPMRHVISLSSNSRENNNEHVMSLLGDILQDEFRSPNERTNERINERPNEPHWRPHGDGGGDFQRNPGIDACCKNDAATRRTHCGRLRTAWKSLLITLNFADHGRSTLNVHPSRYKLESLKNRVLSSATELTLDSDIQCHFVRMHHLFRHRICPLELSMQR